MMSELVEKEPSSATSTPFPRAITARAKSSPEVKSKKALPSPANAVSSVPCGVSRTIVARSSPEPTCDLPTTVRRS